MRRRRWALAGLALGQLVWAGNNILARSSVGEIPPIALSFWRWAIACAVLLPFGLPYVRREWPLLRRHAGALLALSATAVATFNTLMYLAAHTTTAINITLINQSLPIATLPIAWLVLRHRPVRRQLAGITLGLCGTLLIVTHASWEVLRHARAAPGDLLMVMAVLSWAVYSVLLKRFALAVHPVTLITATITLAIPMLLPLYLWEFAQQGGFALTPGNVGTVLYVAIGPSILSFLLWNHGVAVLGPNDAALSNYLHPLFVITLAIPLLGEGLHAYHYAGGLLVMGGVYLALTARRSAAVR